MSQTTKVAGANCRLGHTQNEIVNEMKCVSPALFPHSYTSKIEGQLLMHFHPNFVAKTCGPFVDKTTSRCGCRMATQMPGLSQTLSFTSFVLFKRSENPSLDWIDRSKIPVEDFWKYMWPKTERQLLTYLFFFNKLRGQDLRFFRGQDDSCCRLTTPKGVIQAFSLPNHVMCKSSGNKSLDGLSRRSKMQVQDFGDMWPKKERQLLTYFRQIVAWWRLATLLCGRLMAPQMPGASQTFSLTNYAMFYSSENTTLGGINRS